MPHRNGPLSRSGVRALARRVAEDGRPSRRAAERFQVWPTAAERWADRDRQFGQAGMADPAGRTTAVAHTDPYRAAHHQGQGSAALWPARIAGRLRPNPGHRAPVMVRYRLNHLAWTTTPLGA
jgi:hypothetical protein